MALSNSLGRVLGHGLAALAVALASPATRRSEQKERCTAPAVALASPVARGPEPKKAMHGPGHGPGQHRRPRP